MNKLWRIWCKTMGSRISDCDTESDISAIIRTFYWILNVVTCIFIIANCIRHWND